MMSCLASSSNMGSSKNLLMETSSLRPCGEGRRGGGEEKGREKRMEVGGDGATNRLGPWTNRVWLVTKCKGGLLGIGPTKMATCPECACLPHYQTHSNTA